MANIDDVLDKLLRRTLWIWLPFYALWALAKELFFSDREKKS